MIKINLASRKQAVAADANAGKTGLLLGGMRLEELRELPIRRYVLALIVVFMANYLLDEYKQDELKKVGTVLTALRLEQTKIQTELGKTKGFEEIKKQLDADEFTMRTKIETIEKLIADRQTPSRVLVALSTAIPSEVWLSNFRVENSQVSFVGSSLGFNQISDFMKNLGESAYFTDLRLQNTQQATTERGAEVAVFELQAKQR